MRNLFLGCFCTLLVSCSDVTNESKVLDIDGATNGAPSISEIKVVPLETNDSVVVGNISKMLVHDNRIYIYDRDNGIFNVFTLEGKHISTINKRGAGPQEYILPMDMDVDEEGNIYIADAGSQGIVVYGSNGNFIKRISIGRVFLGIGVVDKDNIWLANVSEDSNINIKLAYYHVSTNSLKVISKSAVNGDAELPMVSTPFFRSGEKLRYYDRFTPYCYSLGKNGQTSDSLKLVTTRIPIREDVEKWVKSSEDMMNTDKITGVSALYYTEGNIFISLTSNKPTNVWYSNDKRLMAFDGFGAKRTMNMNQVIYASTGKYLLSYMSAEQIIDKEKQFCDEVRDVAKKINSESNPVILMYRFE